MKTTYKNEQVKRKFYEWLKNYKRFSPKSVNRCENAICLWEDFTDYKDFKNFNETMAVEFTNWLRNKKKIRSQENVSLTYSYHILRFIRLFFDWLSKQNGYKRIGNNNAVDYLHLTNKENQEATQPKDIKCPDLQDVKKAIENIKGETEIEMRDKALLSLAVMTGARIEAIMTLPMKSFDREKQVLYQHTELGVKTKNSTNITSVLIPFFYKETLTYFMQWYDYLQKQRGFTPENPIFPATKIENGKENIGYYNTEKVGSEFVKAQTAFRKIYEKRFKNAGAKYYNPHSFRHLLVRQISKLSLTEEQKRAFSQNFGHKYTATTFGSGGYGRFEADKQIEIIRNVDFEGKNVEVKYNFSKEEITELIKETIKNNDLGK